MLAFVHLDPRLRGKLDPADVVQQVMARALAALSGLRSADPPVVTAWLRAILASELADVASGPLRCRERGDVRPA